MRPLLAFLLSAAFATPALADDTCMRRNDIRTWHPGPHQTLVLQNGFRQNVTLKLTGSCDQQGFGPYESFTIASPTGSNKADCIRIGDRVTTHWAGEAGVCHVQAVSSPTAPTAPLSN